MPERGGFSGARSTHACATAGKLFTGETEVISDDGDDDVGFFPVKLKIVDTVQWNSSFLR
jgi:hypothetical protein